MNQKSISDKPVSHGEILKKIWKHLDLGVLERNHPFHTPVFGTANAADVNLRIVVLRRFWRKPPRFAFHAHIGSPKIKEIESNPNVAWLFYHPEEKFQLRIKGAARIHTADELADEQWLATEFFARRCYVGDAPSQISKKAVSGLPEDLTERNPSPEESDRGRANFVVVTSSVDLIDCLELNVRGHRRSLFVWNESGELETHWLTP
ncbi:MAG: pyridoxamine 5'-phosphate oxidase family protein [Pyrinomonadaceae bacterium]